MQVEIWSDVVCPWCYIGKRRFEKAAAELAELAAKIEAFDAALAELDPASPALASMKAERDAIAERVAYITDRSDAFSKAYDKEPKP